MGDAPIVERIDGDLESLMERFFANSNEDTVKMQKALDASDFETLTRLGHTAKGTGYGYGFKGMGNIGVELELAAKAKNVQECQNHISRMSHYLATVKVEFSK